MANTIAFINAVKYGAIRTWKDYKILPSLTIAQAALESAWGESSLTKEANNLFGIKAFSNWTGEKISKRTAEYNEKGERYYIFADFRKYSSWGDSIQDHAELLTKERYKGVIGCTDYKWVCEEISRAGYATDPKYPELLKSIIEQYKLYEIDQEVIRDQVWNNIGRLMEEMDIKELQRWLNKNGFTDVNGNELDVDGKLGRLTKSAVEKAKEILTFILK